MWTHRNGPSKFLVVIRWKDWAMGKLPILCIICFYVALAYSKFSLPFIIDYLLFLAFAAVSSVYGYLINEFGDIKLDSQHGKHNTFENVNRTKAAFVVILLFLFTILTGVWFIGQRFFIYLWIGQLFLATFYSIRPFRFKERGLLGIAAAFLAQFPLPTLLLFSAFGEFGGWDMWAFACCATVNGLTLEIGHQRHDLTIDTKTKTTTFGVKKGIDFMTALYKRALFAERISWVIVIMILLIKVPLSSLYSITFSPILPVAFLFGVLFIKTLRCDIANARTGYFYDSYYNWKPTDWDNPYHLIHNYFPNFILLVYLATVTTLHYFPFVIVLIGVVLLVRQNFSNVSIRQHILTILTIFFLKGRKSAILNSLMEKVRR